MRLIFSSVALAIALAVSNGFAQQNTLGQVTKLELSGQFKEAASALNARLAQKALAPSERKQLEFELDRLDRIKKDFPYSQSELFALVKKSVRGLTQTEFEGWVREGRFDSREIDGHRRFMNASVSNLFFRYPELASRRTPPKDTSALEQARIESCRAIKAAALAEHKPYVLPKRFEMTMTVTAKPGAAPAGQVIRAWLPIPRQNAFQGDFDLLSASPPVKETAAPQSAIRSVYLEETAQAAKPARFQIQYDYTIHGVSFDINPAIVRPCNPGDPRLKPFLQEAPHVEFTPELRALSRRIVGDETNPCLKARKCYDWISENIKYSFAIEYSTIRNISDYCRSKGYGDCGQEAMLFIALCRLNGVPARWQTGWNTFPGDEDIHDWSEIYLEPYGWVPVDPYMGIFAMQLAHTLSPNERHEIRDFYFGGLDQYRMIANSDHSQVLSPPKESMRSDNVDFQRGELEWDHHNIYFDKYSYKFELKELKPAKQGVD